MAWDGVYRSKTHYAVKTATHHVALAICGRRLVERKTVDRKHVDCFACLKKLGVIR